MATILTDTQKITVGPVSAVDADGFPTALGGPLVFSLSDPSFGALVPSVDGLSCDFQDIVKIGDVQLAVTDGVLTGTADFTVIAGAEAALAIPVGAPVEQ